MTWDPCLFSFKDWTFSKIWPNSLIKSLFYYFFSYSQSDILTFYYTSCLINLYYFKMKWKIWPWLFLKICFCVYKWSHSQQSFILDAGKWTLEDFLNAWQVLYYWAKSPRPSFNRVLMYSSYELPCTICWRKHTLIIGIAYTLYEHYYHIQYYEHRLFFWDSKQQNTSWYNYLFSLNIVI